MYSLYSEDVCYDCQEDNATTDHKPNDADVPNYMYLMFYLLPA